MEPGDTQCSEPLDVDKCSKRNSKESGLQVSCWISARIALYTN